MEPTIPPPKPSFPVKWIVAGLGVVLVALVAIGAFILTQKKLMPANLPASSPSPAPQPIVEEIPGSGIIYLTDKGIVKEIIEPGKSYRVQLQSGPTIVIQVDDLTIAQNLNDEAKFLTWEIIAKTVKKEDSVQITYKKSDYTVTEPVKLTHLNIIK